MASDADPETLGLQHVAQHSHGDCDDDGCPSQPSHPSAQTLSAIVVGRYAFVHLLQNSSSDLQRQLAWERKQRLHSIYEEKEEVASSEMAHGGTQKTEGSEGTKKAASEGVGEDDEEEVDDVFDDDSDDDDGSESSISSDGSSVASLEEENVFSTTHYEDAEGAEEKLHVQGDANAETKLYAAELHGEVKEREEEDHASCPACEEHANAGKGGINESEDGYGSSDRSGRSRTKYKSVSFSKVRSRSRSTIASSRSRASTYFTDDDMEELKGSIDLGFGFSYDEAYRLKSTLPALELYCAIHKTYAADTSPPSLNGNQDSFRISSPGDSSKDVKHRLRQWAKAVACSIKEGF